MGGILKSAYIQKVEAACGHSVGAYIPPHDFYSRIPGPKGLANIEKAKAVKCPECQRREEEAAQEAVPVGTRYGIVEVTWRAFDRDWDWYSFAFTCGGERYRVLVIKPLVLVAGSKWTFEIECLVRGSVWAEWEPVFRLQELTMDDAKALALSVVNSARYDPTPAMVLTS